MIEVELKFGLTAQVRQQLEARLAVMPSVQFIGQVTSTDVYYDTAQYDCLRRAIFVRIRDQKRVEIKFHRDDDPEHIQSIERTFPVQATPEQMQEFNSLCAHLLPAWRAAATIEQALQASGLEAFVFIKKQRMVYTCRATTLCLDRVEELGDFLEMEMLCEEQTEVGGAKEARASMQEAMTHLHRFVTELALPALKPVEVGYVELWLYRYLPHAYRLGRYQMKEG